MDKFKRGDELRYIKWGYAMFEHKKTYEITGIFTDNIGTNYIMEIGQWIYYLNYDFLMDNFEHVNNFEHAMELCNNNKRK